MEIIIIEDELHSRRLLEGMIHKIRPEWEILATFESVEQSVDWLKNNQEPDLFFMDIQLTDNICFSIFEQVEIKSHVIFTTAYNEFAIQAFKVNSVDYLLKPLKEENLILAVEKFERIKSDSEKNQDDEKNYQNLLHALKRSEKTYRKRFLVAGVNTFYKIETSDIAYFYTTNRITFAVTFQAKEHIIDLTIGKLEEQLDPEVFFRANRSQILNIEAIQRFESFFGGKLSVRLIKPFKEKVLISRLRAAEFKSWLNDSY